MSHKKRDPIDVGTKERAAKGRLVPELTGRGYEFRIRVKDQTELDRLLMNEDISADMWSVLDRFANDLYKAGFITLKAASLEPSSRQGQNLSEDMALKKLTVAQAIKRLDGNVGRDARNICLKACLDEGEVKKPQIKLLHRCVEELEDFYY